jgi:maleate cis-trans isomerase
MKLYIFKNGNLAVMKETTTQSILSDLATYGFFIILFACGIAFELLVGRSWIIEFAIALLMFLWISGNSRKKTKEVTKEELKKIIDQL